MIEEELVLIETYENCGRMGYVESLEIVTRTQLTTLRKLEKLNATVYLGECLGKHSEIYFNLEPGQIKIKSEEQDKILWLKKLMGQTISGFGLIGTLREGCEIFEGAAVDDIQELVLAL